MTANAVPTTTVLARTALYAGLVAGALDIAAAVVLNLQVPARVVFQSVATGWMGSAAYQGGWPTAWLGLASHFGIMLVIAVLYVALVTARPHLRARWIGAGLAWGGLVWVAMTFVVVPLSASTLKTPDAWGAVKGVLTHMIAVGLPMAWIARRMLGLPAKAPPPPA